MFTSKEDKDFVVVKGSDHVRNHKVLSELDISLDNHLNFKFTTRMTDFRSSGNIKHANSDGKNWKIELEVVALNLGQGKASVCFNAGFLHHCASSSPRSQASRWVMHTEGKKEGVVSHSTAESNSFLAIPPVDSRSSKDSVACDSFRFR